MYHSISAVFNQTNIDTEDDDKIMSFITESIKTPRDTGLHSQPVPKPVLVPGHSVFIMFPLP